MARTSAWRSIAAACVAAALFACKEEVTAPGRCPELCPADSLQVLDTVITGSVVADTSIRGYTTISDGVIIVTSSRDSLEAYAVMRFLPLPQFWLVGVDTIKLGVIDSVVMQLGLHVRDTTVDSTRLLLYHLPAVFDTSGVFDSLAPYFQGASPFDSVMIADTMRNGALTQRVTTAGFLPAAADSFIQSIGIGVRGQGKTVAILASTEFGGVLPRLKYYVHGLAPRDTFKTSFDLVPTYDSYVQSPDPTLPTAGSIVVGNQPSSRAFMQFQIPSYFVDSVTIVRATLQLTPLRPVTGFPGESFSVIAHPLLRYFGGKSLVIQDTSLSGSGRVMVGQDSTIHLDVGKVLRLWRGISPDSLPRAIMLRTSAEQFTYAQLDAAGSAGGVAAPRLQISYLRPFTFGVP